MRDAEVTTGKKGKLGGRSPRLPPFTRSRRNRLNVSSGYNAGVRESDYHRFVRYNETHDDGDAVAIARRAAKKIFLGF